MKGIIGTILAGSAALILTGCGGSHTNNTVPNLYEGAWSGTWTGPESKDSGAMTMKIDSAGDLVGTMTRGTAAIAGTVGGLVTGTGKFNATSVFASDGNFVMNGAMGLNSTGALTGSFTYWWDGTLYTGSFTETVGSSAPAS